MKGKDSVGKTGLARWIDAKLHREYGDKVPPRTRPDPLDELVLTVLSQNTNDVNRDRAYGELRRRFSRWEDVMKAPQAAVEESIRVGGLAAQKSERIQAMLAEIEKREGSLELSRLKKMTIEEAREYLLSFKGVGLKTASIVLLFCLDLPAFPVDTHIHRLSQRLGLIPEGTSAEAAHQLMGEIVPPKLYYRFHINMIAHGRAVCGARKPRCLECCLKTKCPSAGKV